MRHERQFTLPPGWRTLFPIGLAWAILAAPGAMDEAAATAGRLGGARFVEALRAHGFSSARILLYHVIWLNLRAVLVRQVRLVDPALGERHTVVEAEQVTALVHEIGFRLVVDDHLDVAHPLAKVHGQILERAAHEPGEARSAKVGHAASLARRRRRRATFAEPEERASSRAAHA